MTSIRRGRMVAIRGTARLQHRRGRPHHRLPDGWRDRLVKVSNANTAAPAGRPRYTGWCPDEEDLCVAKLCAFREKDQNFVAALLDAHSSTPTSSRPGSPRCPPSTSPPPNGDSPGS